MTSNSCTSGELAADPLPSPSTYNKYKNKITSSVTIIIMLNISIAQISIWTWSNALYNSTGNQLNNAQIIILQLLFTNQINSNQMLVFDERVKPEYPGENLSWQSREPTNSIHIWHRVRKSNPGHIGGRQVLSPLGQPCHQCLMKLDDFFTKM